MEFFYNNFDFLYLFICIILIAVAVTIDNLVKLDKINRHPYKYVVMFLVLQAILYLLDIFFIYIPPHIKLEFLRVPLILIAFSVLLEAFLHSIKNKKTVLYIRGGFYLSIVTALAIVGAINKLDWLVYFTQAYCIAVTITAFLVLIKRHVKRKQSFTGLLGLIFSSIYVVTFCFFPTFPLRQLLSGYIDYLFVIPIYIKLVSAVIAAYCIWIHLNNEVSSEFLEDSSNFPKHILAITFILSICAGWASVDFVSKLAEREKITNLENRANLALATLSSVYIDKMITLSAQDAERSKNMVEQRLKQITASQTDIMLFYLATWEKNGKIRYIMEMEPDRYKIYNPMSASTIENLQDIQSFEVKIKNIFRTGVSKVYSPFIDKSGIWTTILVPIKSNETGNVVAVFGMDLDYFSWKISLMHFRIFPILFVLFLSLFLCFIYRELLSRRQGEASISNRNQDLITLNLTLRKTKEELENANKTKSEFLSSMSHELRTPLNAILGFAEIQQAEMFGELQPKYKEYANLIYKSGEHLLSLINDVLDISKIEAGKMQINKSELSLFHVLEETLNITLAYPGAQERRFVTDLPAEDIMINADEKLLKQILLNLLSNAIKFTPQNGEIKLSVREKEGIMKFSIADKGIGISEANLKKILEPFGQVESAQSKDYKGTGLGLSIVLKLIELHDGMFNISSKLGEGTKIEFEIPIK